MSEAIQRAADTAVTKRYEALLRVSQTLLSIRSSEELFGVLARELRAVVSFYVMGVGIYDENAHEMRTTSYGEPGVPLQAPKFAPEETFSWWVYQHQQPLIIPSLDVETRFPAVAEMLKNRGVRSVCALPLTTAHRRLGGLAVGSMETDAYSKEEVSFLSLVANQVALAVDDALNFDASQHAEEALRTSEESFRLIVDSIPAFAWYASPDGKIEYLNQRILDFTAERQENLVGFGWANVLHPDDVEATKKAWLHSVETGEPCEVDQRVRRFDNIYRWFRTNAQPLLDTSGRVIRWYGVATEIEDRKRGAEDLRRSEAYLTQAQKLSQTGSFGWHLSSGEIYWSEETFRIFGYEPAPKATIEMVVQRTHPEDRPVVQELIERVSRNLKPFDFEHRLLLPDGSIKHVRVIGHPSKHESGRFEFVGAVTDITERKRGELLLKESEQRFRAIFNEAGSGITLVDLVSGAPIQNNRALQTMLGCSRDELSRVETYDELTCEQDRESDAILYRELCDGKRETLREEKHFIRKDGRSVWANVIFTLLRDSGGCPRHVIAIHEDITERKQSEEKLKRSEASLVEAQRLSHGGSWSWNVRTRETYWSQEMFRILAFDPEKTKPAVSHFLERVHRDDRARVEEIVKQETMGPYNDMVSDYRIVLPDKTVKHLHAIAHPVTNASGEVIEVIGTSLDVTEQVQARHRLEEALDEIKKLQDQLYKENIALREEVDKTSMFEEIVGTSAAVKMALSRVSKVAPTDSTVLITGETGSGKELIARAVHKRSHRSSRVFISVNCAAIPRDLIASELFGHEKGSFTGAIQRRAGRFELAEGGTIFLDEVGDLPTETQIALLRVLQEHEFERVGGNRSIKTDVRVIAATNRDLQAAIAAHTFRRDLFYRLNVFPIEIPPLRERREDIPLLVEYFIDRYARKLGKKMRGANRTTMALLQSYDWPGNIRELQNVIERSVIVCETDNFSVDESWLVRQPAGTVVKSELKLSQELAGQEKEMIEAALRETGGRVSGTSGAAARLGIHRSTSESKILSLKIDKYRFKSEGTSKDS